MHIQLRRHVADATAALSYSNDDKIETDMKETRKELIQKNTRLLEELVDIISIYREPVDFQTLSLEEQKTRMSTGDMQDFFNISRDVLLPDRGNAYLDLELDIFDFTGSHLQQIDLERASLWLTKLRESHLQQAILRDAKLREADLRDAKLQGADIRGADFRSAKLGGAQLEDARYNDNTNFTDVIGLSPAFLQSLDTKLVAAFKTAYKTSLAQESSKSKCYAFFREISRTGPLHYTTMGEIRGHAIADPDSRTANILKKINHMGVEITAEDMLLLAQEAGPAAATAAAG